MNPFYPRQAPPVSHQHMSHHHVNPSDSDNNAPSLHMHQPPFPITEFPRSGAPLMMQDSMSSHLHAGHHHGVGGGPGFDFNAFPTSQPSFDPSQWAQAPAMLTPDQSPHTATLSVPEDHDYTSEPPRPCSPLVHDNMRLIRRAMASSSPVQRSDGVRKKNAKFDIPTSQTIKTITDALTKETNEAMIKELKKQKRLLKNREAALQSRNRKKEQMDSLAAENEQLKTDLAFAKSHNFDLEQHNFGLQTNHTDCINVDHQAYVDHINFLQADNKAFKRENELLRDQIQKAYSTSTPIVANPDAYRGITDEPADWAFDGNSFEYINNESGINSEPSAVKREPSTDAAMFLPAIPQSTLLTLLMYGAHVASQSGQQEGIPSRIPLLSPGDCAMSSSLLHAICTDAESSTHTHTSQSQPKLEPAGIYLRKLAAANPQTVAAFKALCDTSQQLPEILGSRSHYGPENPDR